MRRWLRAVRELLRGLFGFPARRERDYAAVIEERYRNPRRCC